MNPPSSGTVVEITRRSMGSHRRPSGSVAPLRRPLSRPKSALIESKATADPLLPQLTGDPPTDRSRQQPQAETVPGEGSPELVSSQEFSEEDDLETAELSRLRCTSITTEASQEKQKEEELRRKSRCADYPGLAFGSAMFGSDTMMKFNVIKNELHNIMRSQLRRVDGEVSALSSRIKALDEDLEKSEKYIKVATVALAEAVELEIQENAHAKNDGDELSLFDAQMSLLEGKLIEAKVLAAEASEEPSSSA